MLNSNMWFFEFWDKESKKWANKNMKILLEIFFH